jgi:hypothetical protein
MSSRGRILLAGAGALVLAAIVAVGAYALTRGSSGSGTQASIAVQPAVQRFPNPPARAFVVAREDGTDVLALAVLNRGTGVGLQVSDVNQTGDGATGLHVSVGVVSKGGTATKTAIACGPGCYRADVALSSRPLAVHVKVVRPSRTTDWNVTLPAAWPAKNGTAIVARATRVWNNLSSLRYSEHLSSDPKHAVISDWQVVAPDRLAYQIKDEGQAVIIGLHRWDRQTGGDWIKSNAVRLNQPEPFWVKATDAQVLGSARRQGQAVWRISFFDPRTPGWFLVEIDKQTYRTLDVHMTAAAHFMHDVYSGFNTSIKIDPPTSR